MLTNTDKNGKYGEEIIKAIFYKIQLIDGVLFMASSLSTLANNHADEIYKIKCKLEHDNIKFEGWGMWIPS